MIRKIKEFFGCEDAKKPITDFSAFFHNASSAEKKKLLTEVVREANQDQKDLLERYERSNRLVTQ